MNEENRYNDKSLPGYVPEQSEDADGYYKDMTDAPEENKSEYKTVMDGVPRSRGWSLAAVIIGILSVLLSAIPFVGPVLGLIAVLTSVISRRHLGYFDGVAIGGIILGAIGFVFGLTSILFALLFT